MSRTNQATVELQKENMKFSAGHFTIFSATQRENMHGHNFTIHVSMTGPVDENGMIGDYGIFKKLIEELCCDWNETFLLASQSPYLDITTSDTEVCAHFNGEAIKFLPRDVTLLPIANTTVEELSRAFGQRLVNHPVFSGAAFTKLLVKCASGPGQWGHWTWSLEGGS